MSAATRATRAAVGARAATGVRAAIAAAIVLGAAACGVPVDEAATTVPDDDVPYDLLSPTTSALPSGTPQFGETTVCLPAQAVGQTQGQEELFSLGRDRAGDPPLDTLLALATAGPTDSEAKLGIRSAIEPEDVTDVMQQGRTARVELGDDFAELAADQQLLAVAQITCTLSAQPGVGSVRFVLDDDEIEVPVEGGALVDRAVVRDDYAGLLAD